MVAGPGARARIRERSLPVPGSVIAMAVICSPAAMPVSRRCFCSVFVRSVKYGMTMSLESATPPMPLLAADRPGSSSYSGWTVILRLHLGVSAWYVLGRRGRGLSRVCLRPSTETPL